MSSSDKERLARQKAGNRFFSARMSGAAVLLLAGCGYLCSGIPGHGQTPQPSTAGKLSPVKPGPKATPGNQFYQQLKWPTELPEVPHYPGQAKYVLGLVHREAGNRSISMRYATNDPADQILRFYADSLRQNQWIVEENSATQTVTGRKKGISCNVRIYPSGGKDFARHFFIGYSSRDVAD
jgi:hypothetical protein